MKKRRRAISFISILSIMILITFATAQTTGFAASSTSSVTFKTNEPKEAYDPYACEKGQTRTCTVGLDSGIQECENGFWSDCKLQKNPIQGEVRIEEKKWWQKILGFFLKN